MGGSADLGPGAGRWGKTNLGAENFIAHKATWETCPESSYVSFHQFDSISPGL